MDWAKGKPDDAFLQPDQIDDAIWYLSQQPRRFSELKTDIPGISAKVLSARLKKLEAEGVVIRAVLPTSPPSVEYSLSGLGQELKPAIEAIVAVGHRLKEIEQAAS